MADRKLPTFDELPKFHEYTGCAWDVWGKDDELGTINLLTEKVVAEAAKEIKYVLSRLAVCALADVASHHQDWQVVLLEPVSLCARRASCVALNVGGAGRSTSRGNRRSSVSRRSTRSGCSTRRATMTSSRSCVVVLCFGLVAARASCSLLTASCPL